MDGRFHIIYENWDPISANKRSWDSPLAGHTVSDNGTTFTEILAPAVDARTKPTGKTGTYKHPHWVRENPERFKTMKSPGGRSPSKRRRSPSRWVASPTCGACSSALKGPLRPPVGVMCAEPPSPALRLPVVIASKRARSTEPR